MEYIFQQTLETITNTKNNKAMPAYSNKRGNSPITNYEIHSEAITVGFKGGSSYTYSYNGPAGKYHVDEMKALAINGAGLSAYITQNVKFDYDK